MLSTALLAVLVVLTCYEMVVRYFLGGSTEWGNEAAYMVNGALFLFAIAYTLQLDRHVRIDVLAVRMPRRIRLSLEAAFYVTLFLPAIAVMSYGAYSETSRNFVTGERSLSAWAPQLWPFSAVIAVSFTLLWAQAFAECLRALSRLSREASADG